MAKPATTHVIEIETGIGEPAFIPLTLGQELQPISVGKKGMWRIESARVLDVHAFVYFDGTSLFLQSADESSAASVDGYRVGKAWTELHAPCKIEIGAARLRFRSLIAPADDQAPTEMHGRPPVQASQPGGGPPPLPRPAAGAPPPVPPSAEPITFPKAERPFKPGEFSNATPQDESTRIAPLEATGSRPNVGSVVSAAPRPAAGRSFEEESAARMEGPGNRLAHGGPGMGGPPGMSGPPPGMGGPLGMVGPPGMGGPPGMSGPPPGMGGPLGMNGPPGVGPGGMPMPPPMLGPGGPMPPPGMPSGPYPGGGSGAYNAMGPGAMQSGAYGSMAGVQVAGAPPAEGSVPYYVAKYKELSPPKRILVVLAPFCLFAAAYLLLFDEEESDPRPVATLDASAEASAAANTTEPPPSTPPPITPPPITPPQPACPPNFVPYSVAINGQIPCVPVGTPMPPADDAAAATQDTPPANTGTAPTASTSPVAATTRTLERQAVDYVAVGNYAAAAQVYEQLHQQNPNNRVYAEAARILKAKANNEP
ncbi:MAG: hypothetical protein KIS78_07190 [Labilithrix sp.]|nr:hypothetical protein [Labilithrix sp.]